MGIFYANKMPKFNKSKVKKVAPKKTKPQLTRKEQRKQRALQKKEHKRFFFSKSKKAKVIEQPVSYPVQNQKKVGAESRQPLVLAPLSLSPEKLLSGDVRPEDENESIASDFSDEEVDAHLKSIVLNKKQQNEMKKPIKMKSTRPNVEEQHRNEVKRQKELEQSARKQRNKQLCLQNQEEDLNIARLEKKLKLNRTKDKNRLVRKMFNDGLDYALDLCLDDAEERAKLELREKRRKTQEETSMDDDMHWSEENGSSDERENIIDGDGDIEDNDNDEGNDSAGEDSHGNSEVHSESDAADMDDDNADESTYKEDIYGRKRDKRGNLVTGEDDDKSSKKQKYIPPHLRVSLTSTTESASINDNKEAKILDRLRKQCKGLLNRLSEANLHRIASGIEELYMRNSRYNMNETLSKLLNEALIARTMTKERMVQEHMVLLAYLHAQIGSEIGAYFLQCYIQQFISFLNDEINNLAIEDKRLNNIVLLLSYMYIFKIYEHRLLIEIIDKLIYHLCEKTIECMLLIFQSVGFKLRKDDPVAFKRMTNNVQQCIAVSPLEMKENLRLKFMVETLNAVKHNNINKIPQFDPELPENLRKRLRAMVRNDKYVTTLNITMEDLLRADQVGKWWIVGSAWSGNVNDLGAAQKAQTETTTNGNSNQRFSERLLTLAKQQQMNTEERRNIFCIIMSAEDYVDAFEKILHLALKDQRAISYVVIHCCLNEARPNPYYAHLALKFCNYNRKFQLAFQFASWDRINDIDNLNRQQIKNLGQFLQNLIINAGLQLSVLKVVNFVQLHKSSFLLMRETIVGLLLYSNELEVYAVFERVAKNPKLHQFKNSLRLFMQHFLPKQEASKLKLNEEQLLMLSKRIDNVDKLLAYVDL